MSADQRDQRAGDMVEKIFERSQKILINTKAIERLSTALSNLAAQLRKLVTLHGELESIQQAPGAPNLRDRTFTLLSEEAVSTLSVNLQASTTGKHIMLIFTDERVMAEG